MSSHYLFLSIQLDQSIYKVMRAKAIIAGTLFFSGFNIFMQIYELRASHVAEDGRTGTFVTGSDCFPASLLDLPCVVESFKTYDDSALVKTADIEQMIMVREPGDASPDVEYRHGLNPPMKDARKRRFQREPDLNPELVQHIEKDLVNIMYGGTVNEQVEDVKENVCNAIKKAPAVPESKPDVPYILEPILWSLRDVNLTCPIIQYDALQLTACSMTYPMRNKTVPTASLI
ncbi:hypothetical protein SLA2020_460540 [Shorea laevis]